MASAWLGQVIYDTLAADFTQRVAKFGRGTHFPREHAKAPVLPACHGRSGCSAGTSCLNLYLTSGNEDADHESCAVSWLGLPGPPLRWRLRRRATPKPRRGSGAGAA